MTRRHSTRMLAFKIRHYKSCCFLAAAVAFLIFASLVQSRQAAGTWDAAVRTIWL